MSDDTGRRKLWGNGGVAKNVAGSLEPQPETVTGTPPVSDTEENPFDPREHGGIVPASGGPDKERPTVLHVDSHEQFTPGVRARIVDPAIGGDAHTEAISELPIEKAWDIDPAIRREMLAGEIYRDILNAYWPSFTAAGFNTFNESGCSELFKACASSAVQAADALHEALRSE